MHPSENNLEEDRSLRRAMRDLVALSTLPAVWTGLGPDGIARSLADVLLDTLRLRFVYVRLTGSATESLIEVLRSKYAADEIAALRSSLSSLLKTGSTQLPTTIPDPVGEETIHLAVTVLGLGGDCGVVISGSRQPNFPTEHDRLLLGVAANQAAIVLQRQRAEETVRQQSEWLRVTLGSIGDAVITTDTAGRVTSLNSVAESLTGWPQAETKGQLLEAVFRIVNEQSREAVENPATRALREGRVVGLANHTVLIARDGTERAIDDSAAPIKDAQGHVIGVVLIFRDVTERRGVEQEIDRLNRDLRQRVTEFQTLLNVIPIGIAVADDPGCRRIWSNPAMSRLLRQEERTNISLSAPAQERPGFKVFENGRELSPDQLPLQRATATGQEVRGVKHDLLLDDGTWVSLLNYAVPLYDEAGRIRGGLYAGVDITEQERTRQALRESEAKFRLLADTIPQLAWMARPDGYIFWYNRRWHEYTGTTPNQMEGWGWQSVHDPGELPSVLERWTSSIASGEPFDMVFPLKGADGHFRPFLTRVNPLRDEAGRILYWFGTNTDISDIKRMEAALRRNEAQFRQLADSLAQIVWTAGADGNIDYLNRRWAEFTGLPQTVSNEAWGQILHPDDARTANQRWAASLESGSPFDMEVRLLDRRQQSYRWHLIRTVPVKDEAGRVIRWFGTSTDIDEQKRAEESARYLAQASAELAVVVNYESTLQKIVNLAVPHFADWSAVDLASDDGNLRRLAVAHQDAAKIDLVHQIMREYPPDPQAPTGAYTVLRTGRPEFVSEITDDMLVQGAKDERHLRLVRSLGLKSYLCVPLVVSGNTLGVLTFATAESGRKYTEADLALATDLAHRAAVAIENTQLYQALRDADRSKNDFLATLAHELRNPLAPIRNGLQILRLANERAAREQAREMMERQLGQMVRLVDDLLDISRITRNKLELRKARITLASAVENAVETARPLINSKGHSLSVTLPSQAVYLDADLTRLAQVFWNLLNNAAKYTDPGGRIQLSAECQADAVVVTVRDNGIGIPTEAIPNLFTIFSQVDHSLERSQGGLGIGLALVKGLVGMHGGSVKVHSAGVGRGSEFVVRLPLALGTPRGEEAPSSQVGNGQGKRRILVVDDNRDAAASLAMMLSLLDHDTRTAHDGLEALAVAAAFRPEVVLLDIGMPKLNGYDAARRIRQEPWGRDMVLVACTGWGQEEDRRRSQEAGFNTHLVKPVDSAALEELLADLEAKTA